METTRRKVGLNQLALGDLRRIFAADDVLIAAAQFHGRGLNTLLEFFQVDTSLLQILADVAVAIAARGVRALFEARRFSFQRAHLIHGQADGSISVLRSRMRKLNGAHQLLEIIDADAHSTTQL